MFTDLNNFLNISPDCLTSHHFIGICESTADGSFLIHHFVSCFLKQKSNVILLSSCQSFNHFNSVGNKIGNNLAIAKECKQLSFIEGLKIFGSLVNPGAEMGYDELWSKCVNSCGKIEIQTLFDVLMSVIVNIETDRNRLPTLIIDNLSIFLDIGVSLKDMLAFIGYLKSFIVDKLGGNLILALNNDFGSDDEDGNLVWKFIQHSSNLWLEVRGLDSGYCRDVHGQLTATWPRMTSSKEKSEVKMTQFKLTDKSCATFASGMSSAVL